MAEPLQVIVDTDPGIDDAMALLMLQAAGVHLVAITTVFGNADVATTTRNARFVVGRFGLETAVIAGAGEPLKRQRAPSPVHVHGENGLGDVPLDDGWSLPPVLAGHAADHIVERIRAAPHRVDLLALGPLTNLALALQRAPDIAQLVRQVVVMGGAFGWHGRRGNVSPVAEANIYNDPHAADVVFGAAWPVTAVGLDVTNRCVLTTAQARRLSDEGGEAGRFLWDISRHYESLYRERDGVEGCCLHDVAAATFVLEPDAFTTVEGPIRVVTDGIATGQTIQVAPPGALMVGEWDGLPHHRTCKDVDAKRVVDGYVARLLRR